jgi:hypothetical protein
MFRTKSLAMYLQANSRFDGKSELFTSFVNDYCYLDGTFIVEIIRLNSNYITTSEILSNLWTRYCRNCETSPAFIENYHSNQLKAKLKKRKAVKDSSTFEASDNENEKVPFSVHGSNV